MVKVVWLGNNSARTLTVGDKTVPIDGDEQVRTVSLTEKQVAFLEGRGHRFAKPGSDAASDDPPAPGDNAGVPPVPATPKAK